MPFYDFRETKICDSKIDIITDVLFQLNYTCDLFSRTMERLKVAESEWRVERKGPKIVFHVLIFT